MIACLQTVSVSACHFPSLCPLFNLVRCISVPSLKSLLLVLSLRAAYLLPDLIIRAETKGRETAGLLLCLLPLCLLKFHCPESENAARLHGRCLSPPFPPSVCVPPLPQLEHWNHWHRLLTYAHKRHVVLLFHWSK